MLACVFDEAAGLWQWILLHIWAINLALCVVIVFFRRHDPRAVWTWLLALYFIPVFGFLFYLLLEQDFRKSKMFRVKEVEDRLKYSARNQEEFIKSRDMALLGTLAGYYSDLVVYNLETSGAVLTMNNRVDLLTDGVEKFADLRAELEKASRYIHIQYYIIKNDEVFGSLLPILLKKAV